MVLVIISHEPNCFIDLNIVGIEQKFESMQVLCHYGEPGPVAQKVISYGLYCAAVVRRFDGEIVFVRISESHDDCRAEALNARP